MKYSTNFIGCTPASYKDIQLMRSGRNSCACTQKIRSVLLFYTSLKGNAPQKKKHKTPLFFIYYIHTMSPLYIHFFFGVILIYKWRYISFKSKIYLNIVVKNFFFFHLNIDVCIPPYEENKTPLQHKQKQE